MLMQCGPRSEVVPPKIRRKAENVAGLLAFGRTGLEHGVIHADVFTFGIEFPECCWKAIAAKGGGDFLEQSRGHGQMLLHGLGQSTRTPEKHSAVPKIVSGV